MTTDEPATSLDGKEPNGTTRGNAGHGLHGPKPVEVTSVPQTPLNGGSTPAGGTPRPELNITQEPAPAAAEPSSEPIIEPVVKPADEVSKPSPSTCAPRDSGCEPLPMTGSHQESETHRPVNESMPPKASGASPAKEPATVEIPESATKEPTANGIAGRDDPAVEPESPAVGEKRKLDESAVSAVDNHSAPQSAPPLKKPRLDDAAAAADQPTWPKAPKRKREKKPPTVGRTNRKTRSQGPVDL
ncbi:hypothetical protein E4U53_003527 [Claviceps sorghi]|nr:hypothetical protein E4U53_003527 [Claviceps sorghi]